MDAVEVRFSSCMLYSPARVLCCQRNTQSESPIFQVLACVLFVSVAHLAIGFGVRHSLGELSGISFSAWVALEMFLLVQLLAAVIQHLKSS